MGTAVLLPTRVIASRPRFPRKVMMRHSWRWFGPAGRVTLHGDAHARTSGIVDAPVSTSRSRHYVAQWHEILRRLSDGGIRRISRSFMPVKDWMRCDLFWKARCRAIVMPLDLANFVAFNMRPEPWAGILNATPRGAATGYPAIGPVNGLRNCILSRALSHNDFGLEIR